MGEEQYTAAYIKNVDATWCLVHHLRQTSPISPHQDWHLHAAVKHTVQVLQAHLKVDGVYNSTVHALV